MVRDYDSFSSLRFFLLFNAAGIESEQANSYGIFLVFVCLLVSPSGVFRNVEGIVCIILYYMIASYPLFASVGHLPREDLGGLGQGGGRVFFTLNHLYCHWLEVNIVAIVSGVSKLFETC